MALPKKDSNGFSEFKEVILYRLDEQAEKFDRLSRITDERKDEFIDKLDEVKKEFRQTLDKAKTEIIGKVNQLELKYARIDTKMKFTLGLYTAIGSAFFGVIINIIMQSANT